VGYLWPPAKGSIAGRVAATVAMLLVARVVTAAAYGSSYRGLVLGPVMLFEDGA
jgi:hypothetical protein